MTTLFNLFCPLLSWSSSIKTSVGLMIVISLLVMFMISTITNLMTLSTSFLSSFSLSDSSLPILLNGFLVLGLLNLMSMVSYSYPVTTTLSFNLSMAFITWFSSMMIMYSKEMVASSFLPSNSPWYLAPFLCLIEMVSISVRPITLCFRLLANMSAGHVLLTLICKMQMGAWMVGTAFGVLELMVSMVQGFVFLMLVSVYMEEVLTH